RRDTAFETLDYEVPLRPGWDVPDDATEPINTDRESREARGWDLPEVATRRESGTYDQPAMDSREQEAVEASESWHWGDESTHTEGEAKPEDKDGESPWGWIIGIGVLMLFLVGGRFLSGELFVVAFLALIALQWFLGRNRSDG